MAAQKPTKKPKQFSDVALPGKTAPAQTSRSIIIKHSQAISDPMVTIQGPAPSTTDPGKPSAPLIPATIKAPHLRAPLLIDVSGKSTPVEKSKLDPAAPAVQANHGIQLRPLASSPKPEKHLQPPTKLDSDKKAPPAEPNPLAEAEPVSPKPAPVPSTPKPEVENPEKPVSQPSPAQPSTIPPAETSLDKNLKTEPLSTDRELELAAEAEAERQLELQKLVDAKTYFLPIDSVEKRKTRRFVFLGIVLSILLIVAWGDIALDAGLIDTSSSLPHTHFFSVTTTAPAVTAVPASTVATVAYVSPIDGTKFSYPSNWTAQKSATGSTEFVGLAPNAAAMAAHAGSYQLSFERSPDTYNATTSTSQTNTVASVSYQSVPGATASNPLYAQQVILETQNGQAAPRYALYVSLTSSKSLQVGTVVIDPVTLLKQTVTLPGQTAKLMLSGTLEPTGSDGQPGLLTLTEAQNFEKTSLAKQAESILLSLRAPQS